MENELPESGNDFSTIDAQSDLSELIKVRPDESR